VGWRGGVRPLARNERTASAREEREDVVKHGALSHVKRRAREQKGSGEFEKRARKPTLPVRFRSFNVLSKQDAWNPCLTRTILPSTSASVRTTCQVAWEAR